MGAPLQGITVVALEQAIAAPLCTRHLADLGARVIKVESPGVGDASRHYDGVVRGMAAHFVWLNHGKESAELDVRDGPDRAVFEALLERADVLVSNLAPGALGRLGFAPDDLVERFPRMVVVDISGYGTGGPLDHKRAYDLLIQSEGGACAITGLPGRPAKPGVPVADIGTALYAYSAVLAALYDRERTGRGTVVRVAMLDVLAEMMGFALNTVVHGGEMVPVGLGSPTVAPYSAYPTRDGATVVLGTTNDREWRRLTEDLLERPDLAADPRFARNSDRVGLRDELDAILRDWCSSHDIDDIQQRADDAGIGNARLNDVHDLAAHPQLAERDRWREVDSPVGPLPALAPPAMGADWPRRDGRVPALGEHTDAIRAEVRRAPGGGVRRP